MKLFIYIACAFLFLSCKTDKEEVSSAALFEGLEISIGDSEFEQLENYREAALSNGVLDKSLKQYVKGTISYQGEKMPIRLRLKGDWTDHLKEDKWSFRIKVTGNNSFKGLKSFSIQSPHTRSFLHEWFMHKVYLKEDVLSTRYEFIPVSINGKEMGVYAVEEHFDKQLVEAKNRREGPILKFNEEGVWETRIGDPSSFHSLPYFNAAEVIPFKKNRTLKNPVLKKHFKTAQNLLLRHKASDENIEEILDLERMAKYYALTDLANTDHTLIWHNLRYYYNPVSRKIEPIAYDCYPEDIKKSVNQPIFGFNETKLNVSPQNYIHYRLFNNDSFKSLYIEYLKKYSDEHFLNTVFEELKQEMDSLEKMITAEYPKALFDKEFYYDNVEAIRKTLPDFINSSLKYTIHPYPFENFTNTQTYYYNTGLKAYSSPFQDSSTNIVQFYNFHSSPVSIIGYGLKQNKDSLVFLGSELTIRAKSETSKLHQLPLPKKARTIFFIAQNKKQDTLRISISKWAFNLNQVSPVEKIRLTNLENHPDIQLNSISKLVVIEKGKYFFSKDIIIPKGWTFIIEKGTEIDLTNNAAIISYSPVHAEGTVSDKIIIHSSDSTGQGITIIDNYGNSLLRNVVFSNLNSLHKYGWFLTGAVTFYQSNITIDSCLFEHSFCEDAVNLIQSNFSFSNSIVSNTFSDGFDADFCTGIIEKSMFKNTGNDCIDLSGSTIEINECEIINSGDKGVSGGENSDVKISYTRIVNAKIAVASKDFSTVYISSIALENVEYGYVVFRKKPEFGPAKIIVKNTYETVIKNKNLVDIGSLLITRGEFKTDTIIGISPIDINSLYLDF